MTSLPSFENPIDLDEQSAAAADRLASLYDLPHNTARQVMFETAKAVRVGTVDGPYALAPVLAEVYDSVTEGFAIDVFNVYASATKELEPWGTI